MSTSSTPAIDPKRTALLAMDFQNGIVSFVADPDSLLERVKGAITDVRAAGGTIGCIRVAFTGDDWDSIPAANKFFTAAAWSKKMHHQDPAAQFDERVTPQVGDVVVRKSRFSSIFATGLDQRLRDLRSA
jgi:nicotinamidase-related amidase